MKNVLRTFLGSLAVLILVLALAVPGSSQTQTGAISGRAEDSSGALIPGVEVSVSSPSMIGGIRTGATDEQGSYRFPLLPPGVYRVTFVLPGFKTLNIDGVTVTVGATMTINGPLEVAAQGEEVTVTSSVPTIDLEAATVGVNWSEQKFDDLPYGRFIRGLVQMVPGLYATGYDIGGNTKGGSTGTGARTYGRSGGDSIVIDGAVFGGGFGEYGSYEEVQISTAAKGAESMSPGSTLSFVIKSGSNDFHGQFFTEWEDGRFQSNNVNQKLLDRGFNPSGNKFTRLTDITAEVGGPILRDKLWFFGSYGDTYVGQFVPGFVSLATGQPAVFYTSLHSPTLKLSYQLSSSMKLEASMHWTQKYAPYRTGDSFTPLEATQKQTYWGGAGPTLSWTYIPNAKMTVNVGVRRSGYYWPDTSWTEDVRRTDLVTGQNRGAYQKVYRRPIRWQTDAVWSWFSYIGGKSHEIKSGFMNTWSKEFTENIGYPNQQVYRYRSRAGESDYFLHPDSVQVYDYPNFVTSGVYYNAWFLNDKIQMSRQLTVNAGIRFDRYSSWLPEQGNPGTGPWATKNLYPERHDFPVYNSWLPRLSVVYDVRGDGKLALKASYGRYVGGGSSTTVGSGPVSNMVNPAETIVRTYSNWDGTIPYIPQPQFLASVTGGGGERRLDPNLKPAYMDEFTAGAELGLSRDYTIRFNAVRKMDYGKSKTLDLGLPYEAYSDVRYAVDPGRDNLTGTADDGIMQAWSVPRSNPNFGKVNQFITNTDENEGVDLYTAFETTFNKQFSDGWSLLAGYTADFAKKRNTNPINPNTLLYNWQIPVWSYTLKVNGLYNLPWGLMYSSTYQAQSGEIYGRAALMQNALNQTVTVQVEGKAGRYDWVKLWDNRLSKTFQIDERNSIEAMFNLYNTLNASTVLTQVNTNGPDYLKPLASTGGNSASVASSILPPRIFSLGMRWKF